MTAVSGAATSRGEALQHLEQELGVLLRRARRMIRQRAHAVHPDLQPAAYLMLAYIRDNGPLRASTMCEVFDIDKGAVSRQVQHLLDLGLVDRAADPADGRATLVSASTEGVRRLGDVTAQRRAWMADRLGDWSAEELDGFATTLGRYNEALGG